MPHEMLRKGDLKFRLDGQKLKGDFALVHIRSRKPGSKGNEWLLIKHRDAYVQEGYDIDEHDGSVLTGRTMDEIAGDAGSAEWQSHKVAGGGTSKKNDWLADSIAKADEEGESATSTAETSAKSKTAPKQKKLERSTAKPVSAKASSAAVKKKSVKRSKPVA